MAIGLRLTDRVLAGNVASLFRWSSVLNCLLENQGHYGMSFAARMISLPGALDSRPRNEPWLAQTA